MFVWSTPNRRIPLPVLLTIVGLMGLTVASFMLAQVRVATMFGRLPALLSFLRHFITFPQWSYLPDLLVKLVESLAMAFLGVSGALVVGIPLSFLAAHCSAPARVLPPVIRSLTALMRAVPELVWAVMFVSAVGLGPLSGIMALVLANLGLLVKFFAESLEVVPHEPIEALAVQNNNWIQRLLYGYFPAAMPDFIATTLYLLDMNFRAATILGIVGAGGIGYDLLVAVKAYHFPRLILLIAVIYLVVSGLDGLSSHWRSKSLGM